MSVKRVRMSPELRRQQIIAGARELLLRSRHLPLKLDLLASEAGVSKSLIYAYFPTQHHLFNSLLEDEFRQLKDAGIDEASARPAVAEAAQACARLYLHHVARHGPVLHVILRDPFMTGCLAPELARYRDRIVGRLARLARRELRMRAREAVAAVNMLLTIPEETGRIVYDGEASLETGEEMCVNLMGSSINALRPA